MYPDLSVAFSGDLFSRSRFTIGTDPTAAARCSASWLLLSRARAEAWWDIKVRAVERLFLDAQKWRLVFWVLGQLAERNGAWVFLRVGVLKGRLGGHILDRCDL